MKRSPMFWFGLIFMALIVLFAVFGPTARYHYLEKVGLPLQDPGGQFWFGTDDQGRDVFARTAFGARTSLMVGLIVQAISLVVGTLLGLAAVFGPKWIRETSMRLTDAMFAFPDILLAILIIGVWPQASQNRVIPVIIALSITAWPGTARLVKNQSASLKDREYVGAARALGGSWAYVVRRHVVPHLFGILLAISMVDLAGTILAESALSFLGIGITPPTPSWGNMINDARAYLSSNPMQILWPCLILSLTIFALNFLGDTLMAEFDPKRAQQ